MLIPTKNLLSLHNKILDLIYQQTNELRGVEKKKRRKFFNFLRFSTQTRYKVPKSLTNKRKQPFDYQMICIFLYSPLLPFYTLILLLSTLLVHFEFSFSFVPLQYQKTKENQSLNRFTRLCTRIGIKPVKYGKDRK